MKKILSFLAIAMIMMGLSACSGGGPASTPEEAAKNALNAMKSGDAKALIDVMCDRNGNPIGFTEDEERDIKESEAYLKRFSGMEYTIGNADIDDIWAKVPVTIEIDGETRTESVTCIKGEGGKWRVYNGF